MIAPARPLPIQAPELMGLVPDEAIAAVAALLVEVVEGAEVTGVDQRMDDDEC